MDFVLSLFESPAAILVFVAVIVQIVFTTMKSRKEAKITAANFHKLAEQLHKSETRVRSLFDQLEHTRLDLLKDMEHLNNEMETRVDKSREAAEKAAQSNDPKQPKS